MNFKTCFSTMGCAEFSLEQCFELGQRFNIPQFEIRSLEGTIDLPEYFTNKGFTAASLKAEMDKAGVHIAALNSSLALPNPIEKWESTLEEYAEWMSVAEIPAMRVFDGKIEGTWEEWMANAVEKAAYWRQLKKEKNWKFDLIIETHDSLITAERILEFCKATEDAFPILWDSHHTWKRGDEPWEKTFKACRDHICHIHIKDSISVPSARHPFTYVHFDEGELQPGKLVDLLIEEKYSGNLSLEWERMWHPYLDPLETDLERFTKKLGEASLVGSA